jgi:hypothetical protein
LTKIKGLVDILQTNILEKATLDTLLRPIIGNPKNEAVESVILTITAHHLKQLLQMLD